MGFADNVLQQTEFLKSEGFPPLRAVRFSERREPPSIAAATFAVTGRGQLMRKRSIKCSRSSVASFGLKRLSTFSRRSGSIAASSRRILSRVFFFSYRLQATPAARRAQIIQTAIDVPVIITQSKLELRLERRKNGKTKLLNR
jgi:hypothetical protein